MGIGKVSDIDIHYNDIILQSFLIPHSSLIQQLQQQQQSNSSYNEYIKGFNYITSSMLIDTKDGINDTNNTTNNTTTTYYQPFPFFSNDEKNNNNINFIFKIIAVFLPFLIITFISSCAIRSRNNNSNSDDDGVVKVARGSRYRKY